MALIYECTDPRCPPGRRFIAQFEKAKGNLYMTIHGPTVEIAGAKLALIQEFHALDPKARPGFNLKARLAAIGGASSDRMLGDLL